MSEIPGWAGLCSEFSTSLEDKSPETLSQQTEEKRGVGKTEKGDIFFLVAGLCSGTAEGEDSEEQEREGFHEVTGPSELPT